MFRQSPLISPFQFNQLTFLNCTRMVFSAENNSCAPGQKRRWQRFGGATLLVLLNCWMCGYQEIAIGYVFTGGGFRRHRYKHLVTSLWPEAGLRLAKIYNWFWAEGETGRSGTFFRVVVWTLHGKIKQLSRNEKNYGGIHKEFRRKMWRSCVVILIWGDMRMSWIDPTRTKPYVSSHVYKV